MFNTVLSRLMQRLLEIQILCSAGLYMLFQFYFNRSLK